MPNPSITPDLLRAASTRIKALGTFGNPRISPVEVMAPKRSKFGVDNSADGKARRTVDGIRYDSQLEATASPYIQALNRGSEVQRQVKFPLVVNGKPICGYIADFVVGHVVYEAKGKMTADARIKLKLFKATHPAYTLFLVTKGTSKVSPIHIEEWK